MSSALSPLAGPASRILAVSLPLLSSDRVRRERLGPSWRCAAPPEAAGHAAPHRSTDLPFREAHGSAHRSHGPALGPMAASLASGPLPLALFESVEGAQRLVALCERAQALGLTYGLGVAEARARFPVLDLQEADPAADVRLLEAVADWCDRYTPLVALDGQSGLVLDISGCAHLFGGEAAMMADLLARLRAQGFAVRAAIAPQIGTACALVDHAPGTRLTAGDERSALAPLPVAALRLAPGDTAMLARLGLKRIGDLFALPRAGLARRFGKALMDRLDEASGTSPVPLRPRRPPPLLIHERRLFEPISRIPDVLEIVRALSIRLEGDLARRGEGARRLTLSLFRVDGQVERIGVGTAAPLRDPVRIARLFAERLKAVDDEIDAGFGYDLVRLCVEAADPLTERQSDLGEAQAGVEAVAALLDRLAARLGEAAVVELEGVESHRPERAQRLLPVLGRDRTPACPAPSHEAMALPRPLRLLAPPEPVEATAEVPEGAPEQFRWRRTLHKVAHVEGPERIAPEWWREDAAQARDYWRVEDEDGRRYWLFREGQYGAERAPAWYLHGLFA